MTCIHPHCARHGCLTGCDERAYPLAVDDGFPFEEVAARLGGYALIAILWAATIAVLWP